MQSASSPNPRVSSQAFSISLLYRDSFLHKKENDSKCFLVGQLVSYGVQVYKASRQEKKASSTIKYMNM